MQRTNDHTLKEVINLMLKEYRLNDRLNVIKLNEVWPSVVGKMIANHTTEIYLKNRKLFVSLDNAAMKQELHYAQTKLLKSLNKKIGDNLIDEIYFK